MNERPLETDTEHASLASRWLRHNLRLGRHRDVKLAGWFLIALAAVFLAYVARVHEITHDVFHEMSLFREALVRGDFPQEEVFSYSDTVNPSVHHEWGTGAILYFATVGSGMGLAGLSILKLSLMSALWLVLYRVARMRGAHPLVFATIAFFCFPVFWVGFATVRAQLFTLLFIALQLWMQELDYRGRRVWVLAWLAMLVAWLNLHAGFVVGLGLIAFHSVERFIGAWYASGRLGSACKSTWHLAAVAPFAGASLLLNPYGWQYLPYLVHAIRMPRPLIREWLPLWHTHDPVGTLALFAASLALFVYALRGNRQSRWRGATFLGLSAYMCLKHIRHGSIYGVLWLACVPAWISRTPLGKNLIATFERNRLPAVRVCQAVAVTCLGFACFHQFWRPTLPPQPRYSSASYPSDAIRYLQQHAFHGNLMTPFHVGAYVSWEMYPHVKVSFDGRYEVAYQSHVMPDHNAFYDGDEEWWQILDKYPTDAVLIHKQAKVCKQLTDTDFLEPAIPQTSRTDWRKVYEDDAFMILAAEHIQLPQVDRRGLEISDAALEAFSQRHSHVSQPRGVAERRSHRL